MNVIRGRTFEEEEVTLDHNNFVGCTFRQCVLIYHAHGPVDLRESTLEECSWRFRGPADQMIAMLADMVGVFGLQADVVSLVAQNIFRSHAQLRVMTDDENPHLVMDFGEIAREDAEQYREQRSATENGRTESETEESE